MISTLLFVPGKVTWMIHKKYTYFHNFFHQTVREMRLHKHVARQAKAAGRKINKSQNENSITRVSFSYAYCRLQ